MVFIYFFNQESKLCLPPHTQGTSSAAFDYLSNSFHQGDITGMDVCIRKPIIATCSLDKSIRVWNYENKWATVMYYHRIHQFRKSLKSSSTALKNAILLHFDVVLWTTNIFWCLTTAPLLDFVLVTCLLTLLYLLHMHCLKQQYTQIK